MSDLGASGRVLSEVILLQRLEAFEANRAFFVEMWLQNPALARQAGRRVQALLEPLPVLHTAGITRNNDSR
jgi:hypothetical protein